MSPDPDLFPVQAVFRVTSDRGGVRLCDGQAQLLSTVRGLKGRYGKNTIKKVELIAAVPIDVTETYR